jgi:hypothetical protein
MNNVPLDEDNDDEQNRLIQVDLVHLIHKAYCVNL